MPPWPRRTLEPRSATSGSEAARLTGETPPPIGRLGLFLRRQDEHVYVHDLWPDIAGRLRLLGLWGGLLFLLGSIVDWTHLHDSPPFFWLLAVRLAVLALGLNLWRVARPGTVARPGPLRAALILFELGVIVAFRLVNLGYGEFSPYQGLTALLVVASAYAFVPMLSPVNFWLLPMGTASLFIQAYGWNGASLRDLSALLVIALYVHLLGWMTAAHNARSSRLLWLERQRLEKEMRERRLAESNLRHLFEVCPVPLVLSQQDNGSVLRFNRAAQALLDPERHHTEPGSAYASSFYADASTRSAVTDALKTRGEAGPVDVRMLTSGGSHIHVMLAASSLRFDNKAAVLTSLVEITDRKQREQALTRMTQTDALTGLYNRRGFFERANALLQSARDQAPSLLLIDADHFKRVNDTHGHAVGDTVLVQLANRMGTALREGDVIGRIGGEEFAVFLPATSLENAYELADRIRLSVSRHALRIQGLRVPMTLSIGVTVLQPGENSLEAALGRADTAMYQAKQNGRNRVELAAVSVS
jgi:diguanylate cyclase (GGDEF)-like protein